CISRRGSFLVEIVRRWCHRAPRPGLSTPADPESCPLKSCPAIWEPRYAVDVHAGHAGRRHMCGVAEDSEMELSPVAHKSDTALFSPSSPGARYAAARKGVFNDVRVSN